MAQRTAVKSVAYLVDYLVEHLVDYSAGKKAHLKVVKLAEL